MILLIGLTLFTIAFILHFIVWKIRLPRNQKTALLKLFIFVLVLGLVSIGLGSYFNSETFFFAPTHLAEYFHIGLFFIALLFLYISIYTVIEADSPSLKMIVKIYESGIDGLAKEDLVKNFKGERFVRSRLNHLVKDGMLSLDEEHYYLRSKGQKFLHICFYWRKILGMKGDVG